MDQKTLITFLLDETGSMESIKDDTIGGFNSYIATLKSSGAPIDFTLLKFDSRKLQKVCVAVPIKDVAELTDASYVPGASTPLIDAAYKTIKAVEKQLGSNTTAKIVICIQTDGQENCSTEYTFAELNALIKEKTAAGWQFNFLGTGIDAYDTGTRMGVMAANTMSSGRSAQNVRASFASMARSHSNYAEGVTLDAALDDSDRDAAGDAHYKSHRQAQAAQPQPVAPPAAPTAKVTAKSKAVDDFML